MKCSCICLQFKSGFTRGLSPLAAGMCLKGKFESRNELRGKKGRKESSGFLGSPYWSSVGSLILVARFSRDRRSGNKEVGGW